MNSLWLKRIYYKSIIFSRINYEFAIFTRFHYGYITFFTNSLSVTRIHYESHIFLANSLNFFGITMNIFFLNFIFSRTHYLYHQILINSLRFTHIQNVWITFIAISLWIHKLFLLSIRWIHYWCIIYFSNSLLNYTPFSEFTLNQLPFYRFHYGSIIFSWSISNANSPLINIFLTKSQCIQSINRIHY